MIRKQEKRNSQLAFIIKNNPGLKFRDLMKHTGMKNGVLSHYLGKLERSGTVQVIRGPRETRFYPLDISENESKIIRALRRQTPRDIIYTLMVYDNLEFSEIVNKVNKSPSTVSFYVNQVVDEGIIETKYVERKKVYHIKDKQIIDKLIEDYRPSTLEKSSAAFEDIITSL